MWHLKESARVIEQGLHDKDQTELLKNFKKEIDAAGAMIDGQAKELVTQWDEIKKAYQEDELVYTVRGREIRVPLYTQSLSRQKIPKICLPKFKDPGEIYQWMRRENLPGYFPYTAGVFPLKRVGEDPTRMFAGEGDPARTNARFRLLSADYEAKRLLHGV